MGFLRESEPLSWEEAVDSLHFVRSHGIEQFLAVYRRCQGIEGDPFKWGDEVEHGIFRLVGENSSDERSVKVVLRSPEVLSELRQLEDKLEEHGASAEELCTWMPEYGRWMLESTPARPYLGVADVGKLEASLVLRRQRLAAALRPGEVAPTITSMPLFGTQDFSEPAFQPNGPAAASLFVPDEVIFPHPRFPTLTRGIRKRRGDRVAIRRPLLGGAANFDPEQQLAPVPQSVEEADALDHVYADAMAFGMGNCCLQVTMQAANLAESRRLYDQLAPLTPMLLALTAATPFLRGWICDDDTRWSQVSDAVDDRTPAERGLVSEAGSSTGDSHLAGDGLRRQAKSRYSSIDCYIGEDPQAAKYNDIPLVVDAAHVQRLEEGGLDNTLARHVAHLFSRDPLVLFGDRIHLDDEHDIDHWENLQSTNWQTLRWKPPPPEKGALPISAEGHIGWRVEFRSMEVQMTDFENAAFSAFIVLLSRTILDQNLNLYLPMSKLEENMRAGQRRSACTQERFWFRTRILPDEQTADDDDDTFALMSVQDILCGSETFPGLIPLCQRQLNMTGCSGALRSRYDEYFALLARRASGALMTNAAWMREFVLNHKDYAGDSRVPASAAHDLILAANEIGAGIRSCPELLGESRTGRASAAQTAAATVTYPPPPPTYQDRKPLSSCKRCLANSPPRTAISAGCSCLVMAQ